MIIDFHTHIFPDAIAEKSIQILAKRSGIAPTTNGTVTGLLESMDRSGVDLSVILPVVTKPSQFHSVNVFAQEVNEKYEGRLISFGGIHPDSEDYKEELKIIKRLGLPGIKIHPDYQQVMIDDIRYMNIIDYASELGLVIVTHAGVDIGLPEPVHCTPKKLRKVLDQVKPEKFIAAHMGGWKLWDEVLESLAGENVYFDTAFSMDYMEQDTFMKIWKNHDKGKLLFASDSPWGDVRKEIEVLHSLPISELEKEDIFSSNAKKLLNI